MGIGIRELFVVVPLLIWLVVRLSRGSSSGHPAAADRLAELETLRRAGQISTDEYEKQRATIISRL